MSKRIKIPGRSRAEICEFHCLWAGQFTSGEAMPSWKDPEEDQTPMLKQSKEKALAVCHASDSFENS